MMNRPTPQHPFKSRSFWHSLGFALSGLKAVLGSERNFQIHVTLVFVVAGMGWFLGVSPVGWTVLVLCMALMLATEAMNTAIEYLVDMLAEGVYNEKAKKVKDIAAGACLVVAVGTAIVGMLIFWPLLVRWLSPLFS